jgi:hypothetical protein
LEALGLYLRVVDFFAAFFVVAIALFSLTPAPTSANRHQQWEAAEHNKVVRPATG